MTQTISQLVDALRQKCMEDLGVEVHIEISAHRLPGHDAAKQAAIIMAQELGGEMTGINRPDKPDHPLRWYRVYGRNGYYFAAFWDEKENAAREQAVV